MKQLKKTYAPPVVQQILGVRLEHDLLTGPSSLGGAQTLGQEQESFSPTGEDWYD